MWVLSGRSSIAVLLVVLASVPTGLAADVHASPRLTGNRDARRRILDAFPPLRWLKKRWLNKPGRTVSTELERDGEYVRLKNVDTSGQARTQIELGFISHEIAYVHRIVVVDENPIATLATLLQRFVLEHPALSQIRFELDDANLTAYRRARESGSSEYAAFHKTPFYQAAAQMGFSHILKELSSTDIEEPFLTIGRGGDLVGDKAPAKTGKTPAGERHPRPPPYRGYVGHEFPRLYDAVTGRFSYHPTVPRQLPLDNGDAPLRVVRINFSTIGETASMVHLVFADFVRAMGVMRNLRLRIVVSAADTLKLDSLLLGVDESIRPRIDRIVLPGESDIRIWARDPSLLLSNGKTLLVSRERMLGAVSEEESFDDPGSGPQHIADYFGVVEQYATASGLHVERSPFRFEGGNVLAGTRHVFVGGQIVDNAMKDFNLNTDEALAVLSAEFGKPVILIGAPDSIGGFEQPRQHIDLAMAVVRNHRSGKEVVLLESTPLARRILGSAMPSEESPWFADHLESMLDATEAQLRMLGYDVIRLPGFEQKTGIINYTNAILSGRHALVPHLGISALDSYAQRVYESLGYDVFQMTSAKETMKWHGGPRCLSETAR